MSCVIKSITSNSQRVSNESQGNQFKFWAQAVLNTSVSYEPVNSIWQSISSEMLLLEKHFRDLSIDGQGAMNQSVFVVCRGECNSPSQKAVRQTVNPEAWRKKRRVLMNGCLCAVLPIQVYLLLHNKS